MKIGNIECYGVIYKITNKINNKVYIGQTCKDRGFNGRYDFGGKGIERVYKYLFRNLNKRCVNTHLLASMNKYGLDSFEVNEIFDIAFTKDELDMKEKSWISIYNSTDRKFGYNFTDGGSNGRPTEEVKLKNSLSKIGKGLRSENPNAKKIICLTTGKIFECIEDAAEFYNANSKGIIFVCRGKRKSSGKLEDGTKLTWMYYDDYILNPELAKIKSSENYTVAKRANKRVRCITTGEIFNSIVEASQAYNMKSSANISSCCKGRLKFCGILPDGTKLVWEFVK